MYGRVQVCPLGCGGRFKVGYFAEHEKFEASSVLPDPEYFATIG